MKRLFNLTVASIMMLTIACFSACEKEPKDEHTIASNLAKKGKTDPKLLIGEWEFVGFAYTADGKRVSKVKDVLKVVTDDFPYSKVIVIRDDDPTQYISDASLGLSGPWSFLNYNHFYSISGNLINFSRFSDMMYQSLLHITDEGYDVLDALKNTYSFVIKGKELIIHFTGVEDKNLLILKKRKL